MIQDSGQRDMGHWGQGASHALSSFAPLLVSLGSCRLSLDPLRFHAPPGKYLLNLPWGDCVWGGRSGQSSGLISFLQYDSFVLFLCFLGGQGFGPIPWSDFLLNKNCFLLLHIVFSVGRSSPVPWCREE